MHDAQGQTLLHHAADRGDAVLATQLIGNGADVNARDKTGHTPLHLAAVRGHIPVVRALLTGGADVNAQDTLDGRTALMGAAHKGRNDVIQLLVDHGADLAIHDIGSRDSIHTLAGITWQAIDYADGLVRVGVQSAIPHPESAALLRRLIKERKLPVPEEGRTLASICITELCK